MQKETSCGAVVFYDFDDERKYLIIESKYTTNFGFPKGHVEDMETFKQTAIREVYEECGINIDILNDDYQTTRYFLFDNQIEKHVHYFFARAKNSNIIPLESELSNAYWVNYDDALDRLTFDSDKNIFLKLVRG